MKKAACVESSEMRFFSYKEDVKIRHLQSAQGYTTHLLKLSGDLLNFLFCFFLY